MSISYVTEVACRRWMSTRSRRSTIAMGSGFVELEARQSRAPVVRGRKTFKTEMSKEKMVKPRTWTREGGNK